jgi:hypothetical protein
MQDIFGNVDDLLEMYAEKRASAVLGKEDDEILDPADEEDPDAIAAYEERLVRSCTEGGCLQGVVIGHEDTSIVFCIQKLIGWSKVRSLQGVRGRCGIARDECC